MVLRPRRSISPLIQLWRVSENEIVGVSYANYHLKLRELQNYFPAFEMTTLSVVDWATRNSPAVRMHLPELLHDVKRP